MNRNNLTPSGKEPNRPRLIPIPDIAKLYRTTYTHDLELIPSMALQCWGGLKEAQVRMGVDLQWVDGVLYFSAKDEDGELLPRQTALPVLTEWIRCTVAFDSEHKATVVLPDDYKLRLDEMLEFSGISPLGEDNLYFFYVEAKRAIEEG